MVDTRFHQFAGARTLSSLLAAIELAAELYGDGPLIEGVEELHLAGPGHVALAAHPEYRSALQATGAGVVIVSNDLAEDVPPGVVRVVARDPHMAFVGLIEQLYPQNTRGTVMALLGPYDTLPYTENDVRIGPGVVLGPGVEIGRGTVIGPNTVIGAGVTIGRNATIGSNCSIECAHLGNGVVLHAGARIGSEGFGWLDHGRSNRKIPQLGRVIVQDRVEIGANTTIDRGALDDTIIEDGCKLDNLVHIGHNCVIGRNSAIAGCVGIAGSTVFGEHCIVGGAGMISGHLNIVAGTTISGGSTLMKSIAKPGVYTSVFPIDTHEEWLRNASHLRRLSKLADRIADLEKILKQKDIEG